jgi:hypothetical protein
MFYLQTRALVEDAVFIMRRENKKRMNPRHILTSAVLNGIIPRSHISELNLTPEKKELMDKYISERKAKIQQSQS